MSQASRSPRGTAPRSRRQSTPKPDLTLAPPVAGPLDDASMLSSRPHLWDGLVEQSPDLIFTADLEGRFTAINPAGERALGFSRNELLTMTIADIVAPESLPVAMDLLNPAGFSARATVCLIDTIARDGRRMSFEFSAGPVREGELVLGIQAIGRDVTHRRHAEDELRQSEQRFRLLVEHSADGLLLISTQGRIFFASRPVTRWLGFAPEDLIGRDLIEFLHPDDRDRVTWVLDEAVAQPATTLHAEYRCRHRDGSWRLHEAVLVNHANQPSLNAIVINFRDVTEGRAAASALHESEEQFKAVFESTLMGIVRIGLDGRILDVNRAILEMGGFARHELIGKTSSAFVHPDDLDEAVGEMRKLVSGQQFASRAERRYVASSGKVFWANVTAALVRNAAGEPQFVLALLENITERKQTEDDLRRTNENLSVWVKQLEQQSREIGLLNDMGDLLRACRSPEEACRVIVPIAAKLFLESVGVVSIVGDVGATTMEPAARWGGVEAPEGFGVNDCWALRRGRAHVVTDRDEGPICRHLSGLEGRATMCVPIMAHGVLLGTFSVLVRNGADLTDSRQRLVTTVAEHLSLALANLRLEETLRSQSIRDPLTGLFNRRYMEESLEREMRRAGRNRASVGIIMLDLDHFKAINDTYGHDGGDAVLKAVGAVLQRSIRAEDIACRYGGEEFTLILPEANMHEAAQRADYIRQAVKQVVVSHRRQTLPAVTMSAGVATCPEQGTTADAVLRAADTALYQAKQRGRDMVILNQTGTLFPDSMVEYTRRP